VTPISPIVRVTGVLQNADVKILDNGKQIGRITAPRPGELLVPIKTPPTVGHRITATQTTSNGTSDESSLVLTVITAPSPLPVPGIQSALNTCMADIWAVGLVPGARVITKIGGQEFASILATETSGWLGIYPTLHIAVGSQVELHQEAAGFIPSMEFISPPIPAFGKFETSLDPPGFRGLLPCSTDRDMYNLVPGANTTIVNEGQTEVWVNAGAAMHGYRGNPLKPGTLVAQQTTTRCPFKGRAGTFAVARGPVNTPTVSHPLCPDTLCLTVFNLVPLGLLNIKREVKVGPNGTELTLLGDHPVSQTTEIVDLPRNLRLTDPAGPVHIGLDQFVCGDGSDETLVDIAPSGGPFGPPQIAHAVRLRFVRSHYRSTSRCHCPSY